MGDLVIGGGGVARGIRAMVMAALLLLIVAYAEFGALLFRDRQCGVGAILYMASFGGLVLLLLMYGMRG